MGKCKVKGCRNDTGCYDYKCLCDYHMDKKIRVLCAVGGCHEKRHDRANLSWCQQHNMEVDDTISAMNVALKSGKFDEARNLHKIAMGYSEVGIKTGSWRGNQDKYFEFIVDGLKEGRADIAMDLFRDYKTRCITPTYPVATRNGVGQRYGRKETCHVLGCATKVLANVTWCDKHWNELDCLKQELTLALNDKDEERARKHHAEMMKFSLRHMAEGKDFHASFTIIRMLEFFGITGHDFEEDHRRGRIKISDFIDCLASSYPVLNPGQGMGRAFDIDD